MKRILPLFIMLFLFGEAKAQNWQPFNEYRSYYLSTADIFTNEPLISFIENEVVSLSFDDITSSNDTIIWHPHSIIGCDSRDRNSHCFNWWEPCTELHSFVGSEIIKTNNFWFIRNRDLDSIRLPINFSDSIHFLEKNDTSYFLIKISNVKETVLNSQDSVFYFKILTIDSFGNTLSSIWENDTIILSKNHGFIKAPSWYLFPKYKTGFQLIDQNNIGQIKGLSYNGIYDYSIGDLIQYREEFEEGYIGSHEIIDKSTLIGHCTVINRDTLLANQPYILSCQVQKLIYNYIRDQNYNQHFSGITSEISADTILKPSPYNISQNLRSESGWNSGPTSLKKSGDQFVFHSNHNSQIGVVDQGCYIIKEAFEPPRGLTQEGIIGIGVTKIDSYELPSFPSTYSTYSFNLTYFKSDSVEYGSPGWPIGLDEVVTENRVTLFPNPVQNVLHIQSDEPVLAARIYSISGTLINSFSSKELTQHQLDLSSLSSGIYLLQLQLASLTETHRLVK